MTRLGCFCGHNQTDQTQQGRISNASWITTIIWSQHWAMSDSEDNPRHTNTQTISDSYNAKKQTATEAHWLNIGLMWDTLSSIAMLANEHELNL